MRLEAKEASGLIMRNDLRAPLNGIHSLCSKIENDVSLPLEFHQKAMNDFLTINENIVTVIRKCFKKNCELLKSDLDNINNFYMKNEL